MRDTPWNTPDSQLKIKLKTDSSFPIETKMISKMKIQKKKHLPASKSLIQDCSGLQRKPWIKMKMCMKTTQPKAM